MKKIKFIQINIFKGKYLANLLDFLKAEDPDFISMQEVTTYNFNSYEDKSVRLFELLKKRLGMFGVYNGDLKLKGDSPSTFGNAIFSKLKIVDKNVITLREFRPVSILELDGTDGKVREVIPRHLLDAVVDFDGVRLHVLSWHGAWTAPPVDTFETLRQAKIVADYLRGLQEPFIMGGDLNNVPKSRTVELIERAANNLMKDIYVEMTTHPKIHKIAPKGFLIDYIFTSKHFKLLSIDVPVVEVSDHLPVVAQLEFQE